MGGVEGGESIDGAFVGGGAGGEGARGDVVGEELFVDNVDDGGDEGFEGFGGHGEGGLVVWEVLGSSLGSWRGF